MFTLNRPGTGKLSIGQFAYSPFDSLRHNHKIKAHLAVDFCFVVEAEGVEPSSENTPAVLSSSVAIYI